MTSIQAQHEQNLADLAGRVQGIARRAGRAIVEIYQQVDPEVTYKEDDSPLTAADLASHRIIVDELADLDPSTPVLSEEGAGSPYETRAGWERFWLVDPLDGTKEFVKKNGEFTVNIALVEGGEPSLGVVHAPVLDRTYWGARGVGARRTEKGNDAPIEATGTAGDELVVVASRSHAGSHLEPFLERLGSHRLTSMGSSLKLCLVADGTADVYPRLGPTMEWDTAAAHGVVLGAGGEVLDFSGSPLRYNKENLLNPFFIVLGRRDVPWQSAYAATGL